MRVYHEQFRTSSVLLRICLLAVSGRFGKMDGVDGGKIPRESHGSEAGLSLWRLWGTISLLD
jgi:hypothetical protein